VTIELLLMCVGFILAAYSIVANDAIQTLGTFLSSNSKRHWAILWVYACAILTFVILYTYFAHDGDLTYGRLGALFEHQPRSAMTVLHIIPPLLILLMTRFGWPVSTTFLVLTVFANKALGSMLLKSVTGYVLAFVVGVVVYVLISSIVERRFLETRNKKISPVWVWLQWISTGWLWSQWLIQDLANIFVFLPYERRIMDGEVVTIFSPLYMGSSLILMWALHAWVFANRGGAIQKIVTSKTNTTDIRAATIIDFMYGTFLFIFKEMNDMPMSTTWVFIGLLAGRELGMTIRRYALRTPQEIAKAENRKMTTAEKRLGATQDQEGSIVDIEDPAHRRRINETFRVIGLDASKALAGLVVSVLLAYGLPRLYTLATGQLLVPTESSEAAAAQATSLAEGADHGAWFLLVLGVILVFYVAFIGKHRLWTLPFLKKSSKRRPSS
jgi:hypothetical protein